MALRAYDEKSKEDKQVFDHLALPTAIHLRRCRFISMLESGHKYPNLEMVFKLAGALGVRPGTMLDAMEERLKL